jgi:hypothetical protein
MIYPSSIDKLAEWMKEVDATSAIMQADNVHKKPIRAHSAQSIAEKGLSEWTNESYKTMAPTKNWCILLGEGLMAIDFDTAASCEEFKTTYPNDFTADAIHETTTHGTHYYFKRPDFVYNRIAAAPKVDIKAIERTGTRSAIICAPSANKAWVTAPWDGVLREPSIELQGWLKSVMPPKVAASKSKLWESIFGEESPSGLWHGGEITTLKGKGGKGDFDEVGKLLSIISPECGYERWFKILCTIADCLGKHEAYDLADDWSSGGSTYDSRAFGKTWNSIRVQGAFTISTLHFYAKEENPERYSTLFPRHSEMSNGRTAQDDNQASDIFLGDVEHILRKCGGRLFMLHNHVWTEDKGIIDNLMLRMCLTANITRQTEDGPKPYSAKVSSAKNIILATMSKLEDDPEFVEKLWRSNIGKLCFNNGVYDFATRTFLPWAQVNDVFTTLCINRDFPTRDDAMIESVTASFWTRSSRTARRRIGCGSLHVVWLVVLRTSNGRLAWVNETRAKACVSIYASTPSASTSTASTARTSLWSAPGVQTLPRSKDGCKIASSCASHSPTRSRWTRKTRTTRSTATLSSAFQVVATSSKLGGSLRMKPPFAFKAACFSCAMTCRKLHQRMRPSRWSCSSTPTSTSRRST